MREPYLPRYNWPTIKRAHERVPIPYGYKLTDEDILQCIPDPDWLQWMEQAVQYVDEGRGYEEVAKWLETQTGKSLSHQAMKNIWWRVLGNTPESLRAKEQRRKARKKPKLTAKEKAEREVKLKVAAAKRSLTRQSKKLEGFEEQKQPEPTPTAYTEYVGPEEDELEDKEIAFAPNPGPQSQFLAAIEQEVLYGGAAGGGKSYALIADPMRYFDNQNFNGIIFRRTNDELRELKVKAQQLYFKIWPEAKWREKDSTFVFPSGARLWFTYLERDDDVLRYQGQAFNYIAFDELTQYPTPYAWEYMRSRLRTTDPSLPLFMRATTNPGGPGHGWVKKLFIDPAPYNTPFDARDIETGEVLRWPANHPKFAGQPLFQRRFIPARLSDNKYLYEDGQYEANLLSLSEGKRRQLLEGDWTIAEGAAFPEFSMNEHVVKPFQIPSSWRKFRSCDYGYSSFSAVHWFAIDPVYETLVVYRELYVSKKTGRDLALLILELERGENISYGILDSSVWHQRGNNGPTIAEEMIGAGTRWRPSDRTAGARVNGKNRLHELLKVNELGYDNEGNIIRQPGIVFFDTCRQIIADLPVIPSDPDGSDDIDSRYASDHAYDSIRYGVMSRPRASSPFDSFGVPSVFDSYQPFDRKFGY